MRTDILDQIAATGSKLEKERLLKTVDPETVEVLKYALDPMITFGVTVAPAEWLPEEEHLKPDEFWKQFLGLCEQLAKRDLTGNAAGHRINDLCLSAPTKEECVWAARVLNKDLRSGFSMTTLNKAFPGAIEPFVCSLAKVYEPDKHDITVGNWTVEPKLDGLRMLIIDGVAYTRNGRTIDSVGHILEQFESCKNDFVLDGEIMGSTGFDEDSGKIRKKGEGPNLSLTYNVFDCVRRGEWHSRKTVPYSERRKCLEILITGKPDLKYVKLVPSLRIPAGSTVRDMFDKRDHMIALGYEGAMLKSLDAPYVFKRSDAILKLKDFTDADCRVVDWFEGLGKHKGRLGGIIVEDDKGVRTRVGSGFSDAQRDELWRDQIAIPGRIAEIQYQNLTAEGSMRFPVFVQFRPDKE